MSLSTSSFWSSFRSSSYSVISLFKIPLSRWRGRVTRPVLARAWQEQMRQRTAGVLRDARLQHQDRKTTRLHDVSDEDVLVWRERCHAGTCRGTAMGFSQIRGLGGIGAVGEQKARARGNPGNGRSRGGPGDP